MPEEREIELARRYFTRLINERDLSVCSEMLARDYVDHDDPDYPPGPEATERYVKNMLDEYPDLTITIEDAKRVNGHVFIQAVWNGRKANGETMHVRGKVNLRFNSRGQIVERSAVYEDIR